jgi:hypothetical protein
MGQPMMILLMGDRGQQFVGPMQQIVAGIDAHGGIGSD